MRICCYGDSVTEGMGMEGHHYAEYGKFSYPAQLKTILTDCGYQTEIFNYGHGGERIAEVMARCGAAACITTEDLTLSGNGSYVSLGKRILNGWELTGTKLKMVSDEDRYVCFKQLSHDTNPIMLGDVECEMRIGDEYENLIAKKKTDGQDVVIPKGTLFFTANQRNADVNIFYAGINDGSSLTLKKYIQYMRKCSEVNGGKYIVLGCTHAIWKHWKDMNGSPEEQYELYKRECYKAFGIHFIDLYGEFAHKGITEKDVHLSKEGYRVMAELIFERMKALSYI